MKKSLLLFITLPLIMSACENRKPAADYPIQAVPNSQVQLNDPFWAPRIERNLYITIPAVITKLYETGRVKNFQNAGLVQAGKSEGEEFCTAFPFDDSDIYKLIDAGSLAMGYARTLPGSVLDRQIDSLISLIAAAQEPDGYLYTARTMKPKAMPEMSGAERWINEQDNSHELYNLGHLYEAACTHYEVTGKRTLLDVATRSADFLYQVFIKGGLKRYPGHEEIETGLAHLYRTTGKQDYLELAAFFLENRGPGGQEYNQAHKKPIDQTEAAGHAVRAVYLYSGMTEVGVLNQDSAYLEAVTKIWDDIIRSKTYITGGIGSKQENEGFGDPYDLPNHSAYCETCSSIGFILWNYRMFRLTGDSKYVDVLEKTLYNAFLSGVSISGDHFFYPNPLESWGRKVRPDWYACACCPPNVARMIPMVPGFQYATSGDKVYVNLYAAGTAKLTAGQTDLSITQRTNYPWNGSIDFAVDPTSPAEFSLLLRIPGWAVNQAFPSDLYRFDTSSDIAYGIFVNNQPDTFQIVDGYAVINRKWKSGDKVSLQMPMPVRIVRAHDAVAADKGKVAYQRGPVIYCAEAADNANSVLTTIVETDDHPPLQGDYRHDLLGGVYTITGNLEMIPYFAWAKREPGQMVVWFPTAPEYITHFPTLPGLEARVKASASYAYDSSLPYLNDGIDPMNSADRGSNAFRLHPHKGTTEWIVYEFDSPIKTSSVEVYWLQDGSYGLPVAWSLSWQKSDGTWIPVNNTTPFIIEPDHFNQLKFKSVQTKALKLEMTLSKDLPGGIIEWRVK